MSTSRWPRPTSTSPSSSSSRTTSRCARRTSTRCAAWTTPCRTLTRRQPRRGAARRRDHGRRPPAAARRHGPHPAVLLIPGLDSTKEEFRSTEKTFLDRGLATFSVDGPGQGEAEYDLPIRGDWSAPGLAFLDALAAQPDVDADRLAVWGVSLGGYYAPRVAAAAGDRVRACVALAGPVQLRRLLGPASRSSLATPSGSARRCGPTTRRAPTRRRWTSAGHAGQITAPLLVVTGKLDRLIPWQHAERLAARSQGRRAAAARGRQPRLHERLAQAPARTPPTGSPRRLPDGRLIVAGRTALDTRRDRWLAYDRKRLQTCCTGRSSLTERWEPHERDHGSAPRRDRPQPAPSAGSAPAGWARAMAARLARAGADLAVWNRTRAKAEPLAEHGATVVDTIADLRARDVVFTMVSTSADLEQVLTGEGGLIADPGTCPRSSSTPRRSRPRRPRRCARPARRWASQFLAVAGERQRQGRRRRHADLGRARATRRPSSGCRPLLEAHRPARDVRRRG